MALPNISLAEFNRIATGEYNAGQIDFKTNADGSVSLVKINNHVTLTGKNNVKFDQQRILDIKETFINALRNGGVKEDALNEIRANLGLAFEVSASEDKAVVGRMMENRFKPLSRDAVRTILDTYARQGRGMKGGIGVDNTLFGAQAVYETNHMSASNAKKRDAVNAANAAAMKGVGSEYANSLNDVIAVISGLNAFSQIKAQRDARFTGPNAVNDKAIADAGLKNNVENLFKAALSMIPADATESGEFLMEGIAVKFVKDADGNLSALVGNPGMQTRVNIGCKADAYVPRLVAVALQGRDVLGTNTIQHLLDAAYNNDLDAGITAEDRTSITRFMAAFVLEGKASDAAGQLIKGNYNTNLLYNIASDSLDGKGVWDTKAKLEEYHAELAKGNADLSKEMKQMLLAVADIPLEKCDDGKGEFKVANPIVADIGQAVAQIPAQDDPAQFVPKAVGLDGIKNFIADLVFSDDTMVGDVKDMSPSERMREFLADGKRLSALIAVIKNPAVIDTAVAVQIAPAVRDGFAKIVAALNEAFKADNNGETLGQAAAKPDFEQRFAAFFKDPKKLPGTTLAKFEQIVQSMANKGCDLIQTFINGVFKVDLANANAVGAVTNEPYKDMSAAEIKKQLDGKNLNQILDAASNSDSPGQIGFFRQIISTYFTQLSRADKRAAFASAMRYADTFDFDGKQGDELRSAEEAAINKFTGAILKGTSPLLQKMLQGLPKDIVGQYADALEDMKCKLAPIPRKVVQAHLMRIIDDNNKDPNANVKIKSIELTKSLGAASVGEAFLCKFTTVSRKEVKDRQGNTALKDVEDTQNLVVKIMRHDAVKRVNEEAKIFTAAAEKIPGMAKTWAGQLNQYMTEFNFENEARNVEEGVKLYDIANNENHSLNIIAPKVASMKLSTLVPPKSDVMVCEEAIGSTADSFFKDTVSEIRNDVSSVFEKDPATGRVKWEEKEIGGKQKQVPVLKSGIPALSAFSSLLGLGSKQSSMRNVSNSLMQATKAWFHEALLGSGKFHGDTHAGNLMVTPAGDVTFIDFGNLYQLQKDRSDGVNEQQELLRIILGAAFRDKKFILDGFTKLMTDAGRTALDANRNKAEAILDSVLDKSKGGFSFNIVYRLQAAVVELQKLGLELPPQINCFIQSMVRLSNSVTEMNTITNQCITMVESLKNLKVDNPPQRDELDLLGKAFDVFASDEGKQEVVNSETKRKAPRFVGVLQSEEFGLNRGVPRRSSTMFKEGIGTYTVKVRNRIGGAQNPLVEAERLVNMLATHADPERNLLSKAVLSQLDEGYAKFKTEMSAAKTDDAKAAAVAEFADCYSRVAADMLDAMYTAICQTRTLKFDTPKTFATGLTDILLDNFDVLQESLTDKEGDDLKNDAVKITWGELGRWTFDPNVAVDAMKADAESTGGDNDYKIDIGV